MKTLTEEEYNNLITKADALDSLEKLLHDDKVTISFGELSHEVLIREAGITFHGSGLIEGKFISHGETLLSAITEAMKEGSKEHETKT